MNIKATYIVSVLSDLVEINRGVFNQNFRNKTISVKFGNQPMRYILTDADRRFGTAELNVPLFIDFLQGAQGFTAVLEGDMFTVRVATLSGRRAEEIHPSAIYFKLSDAPDGRSEELRDLLRSRLNFEDEDDVQDAA